MNKEKRIAILTRLRDENPHPTTELNFTSPFELLIAVLLSAQATDVSVNKATALLYPVANTPKAMLELGVEGEAALVDRAMEEIRAEVERRGIVWRWRDQGWSKPVA